MKHLDSPHQKANWQNELLKDLNFIKQHKRYPMGKRTISPALLSGLLLLVIIRIGWPLIFLSGSSAPPEQKSVLQWSLTAIIVVFMAITIYQAIRVLKFDELKTPFFLQQNVVLLHKFFTQNRLAYTQHPEAPEVFMIISRNLDANTKNDYREVMVFIADDNQILVNSHFTGKKFNITPPSRNYKRMARELQQWLNDEQIKNNDNSLLPVNSL